MFRYGAEMLPLTADKIQLEDVTSDLDLKTSGQQVALKDTK